MKAVLAMQLLPLQMVMKTSLLKKFEILSRLGIKLGDQLT
jgi:hypothetical protein